jgi:hypothetical protein
MSEGKDLETEGSGEDLKKECASCVCRRKMYKY